MFFTKRKAIILIIICSIFFILTYNDVRSEEIKEISGNAQIIDGDTIKINSKKIRLHGIDAPEFKQMCKKTYLTIVITSLVLVILYKSLILYRYSGICRNRYLYIELCTYCLTALPSSVKIDVI